MAKKPVLLCIMDGFGWVPGETYGNAVVAAKTPHLDALMAKYPMTTIEASGMAVGLPDGQMGNSEVGHTNMGAGRIVYQQLTLITKSIKDGEMLKNPVLVKNMQAAIDAGKAIHLMGLVGTGGVHSHADHWFGVLEMAKHMGANRFTSSGSSSVSWRRVSSALELMIRYDSKFEFSRMISRHFTRSGRPLAPVAPTIILFFIFSAISPDPVP